MTREDVIQKLKDLSKDLNKTRLTTGDIRKVPKLQFYIYEHFDNLAEALNVAGLDSSVLAKAMASTNDDLLKYLWGLGIRKGKVPSSLDVNRDRKYNYKIFSRRFGNVRKAYEVAKATFEQKKSDSKSTETVTPQESISTEVKVPIKEFEYKGQFYGIAAENLVVSELLYRGYEAYLINVDLGLDVMGYKDGKTYYFQVKNISFDNSNTRTIQIKRSSYTRNKANNVYYFLIMQTEFKRDYVIIPQFKLQELEEKGITKIEDDANLSLTFSKKNNTYFIKFASVEESLDVYTNKKGWGYLL